MAEQKIIAIVGATGAQGGGLARAILNDTNGGFRVRALTRDPSSEKARGLADAGAEVVSADVNDEASLARAFEGAYGAFCVTFFWQHMSAERELTEAANMARAAKTAGIRHAIWSTLDDSRQFIPLTDMRMPTLQERYKIPHFDAKAEADRFFTDAGVPTTFLLTTFYWDNFVHFGAGPKAAPDGTYALTMPLGKERLAGIASEDIGRCAYGIFNRPDLIGKTVGIAGELLTGGEMAAAMSRALGVTVRYNEISPDAYRALGFPGADEMGNMFEFYRDFHRHFEQSRSVAVARSLNPELQSFDAWLASNAKSIPLG